MNKLYTLQFVVRVFSRHRTLRPQRGPIASSTFVTHLVSGQPLRRNCLIGTGEARKANATLPNTTRHVSYVSEIVATEM